MKRFLAIALAVLMLAPLCIFNISGAEAGCTVTEQNCAKLANFSFDGACWYTRKNELVDGDKSKGMAGSYVNGPLTITMSFDDPHYFTNIVLTVNSEGTFYGPTSQPEGFTNADFMIDVKVYDKNKTEIVSATNLNTVNQAEITVPVNAEASTIVVVSYDGWEAFNGIWEIETFEQVGEHSWTLKSTNASTCVTKGRETYECDCGSRQYKDLPLRPYHRWDNGTETVHPTETTEGTMTYDCLDCSEIKNVAIPATVHNAWDTGVVTAPKCTEEGYTTYTCTHCSEGVTKKADFVNPLGHDMDEGTPVVRQTFTTVGSTNYKCERTGCDYNYDVEVPVAEYTDSIFVIDDKHATLTETDLNGVVGTIAPEESAPAEALDGLIMSGDLWSGKNKDNFWKAPSTGGKLIIEFDQEYLITAAKIYAYGNYLSFDIEFFDAEGNSLLKSQQRAFQTPSEGVVNSPVTLNKDIYGKYAKKVVITALADYGKTVSLSEVVITAHACLYDEKTNVVEDPTTCKTTFDGTCWMCEVARTNVVEYNHTYEQVEGVDKIEAEVEATCFQDGAGTKTCTVCEDVDYVIIKATGEHVLEKEVVVEANDCGNAGIGYKQCTTAGCSERTEDYVLEATGEHSKWNWKIIPGEEPDYTHTGLKGYYCGVCGYKDPSKEDQVAAAEKLSCVSQKDWSIRYTDFVSPRATFKISLKNIEDIEDEFDVKIFGVVQKGEATKEIQVYGEGATGVVGSDGTFSLVVKGASYTDEFKFSVRIEITCKDDDTSAESTVTSKNLTTAADGIVSVKDVASYFLAPNRADALNADVKKFYESIVG